MCGCEEGGWGVGLEGTLALSLSYSLSPEATWGSEREATEARLLFPLPASWVEEYVWSCVQVYR